MTPTYQSWRCSHTGRRRAENSDAIEIGAGIWVVADGFGAPDRATGASSRATQGTVEYYEANTTRDPGERLRAAIEAANLAVHEMNSPELELAGATLVAVAIHDSTAYVAGIGRCRAYLIRDGSIAQITEDHTWVAAQVAAGKLTESEAREHPRRNVVTRALGPEPDVPVDIAVHRLEPDDRLLLCTDGLTRPLEDSEILAIVAQSEGDPATRLVEEALDRGTVDDVSALVIARDERPDFQPGYPAVTDFGGSNLTETVAAVMRGLEEAFGASRVAIVFSDSAGRPDFDNAHIGGEEPDDGLPEAASETIRRALAQGEPLLLGSDGDQGSGSAQETMLNINFRSALCSPLRARGRTIGAVYLERSLQFGPFTESDAGLLATLSGQAAAAIDNARLHDQTATQARQLQRAQLHQQSIIRSLTSALIAIDQHGNVTTWNPAAGELTGIPAGEAMGRRVFDILPNSFGAWLRALASQAEQDDQTIMIGHDWVGPLAGRNRVILTARVAILRSIETGKRREGFIFLINDLTEIARLEEARKDEVRRRQQIHDLFGRYLAPRVVTQILEAPDDLRLGGVRREISVLFADLRGFTTLSEKRQPEEVVAILNRYLSLATEEIFRELGTPDKFLGDGVLALFNAPVDLDDHPAAAVRAAIQMRDRLDATAKDAEVEIGFGIGITTGPAIVGNIGAPELMNYTAVGDTVNLASRLQGEAAAGEVLISESTYLRVADRFSVQPLGPVVIRGRSQAEPVYRVIE